MPNFNILIRILVLSHLFSKISIASNENSRFRKIGIGYFAKLDQKQKLNDIWIQSNQLLVGRTVLSCNEQLIGIIIDSRVNHKNGKASVDIAWIYEKDGIESSQWPNSTQFVFSKLTKPILKEDYPVLTFESIEHFGTTRQDEYTIPLEQHPIYLLPNEAFPITDREAKISEFRNQRNTEFTQEFDMC